MVVGRFFWAKDMGSDFDPKRYGLKPVHFFVAAGMVFICVAEHAPDLTKLKATADQYTVPHRLDDLKVAYASTITESAS